MSSREELVELIYFLYVEVGFIKKKDAISMSYLFELINKAKKVLEEERYIPS